MSAIPRNLPERRQSGGACQATAVDGGGTPAFGAMVGDSPAMRAAFASLCRAAESDSTVLLYGEPGTGKRMAAESIHAESARRAGPFVVVDCVSDSARSQFEQLVGAHTGSIFFDGIGELGRELQARLLRTIERSAIDARVIAATHRQLAREVEAGHFRADLYYRIAVIEVRLPPLRERHEDIPLLIAELLARSGAERAPEAELLRKAYPELMRHGWPGNVRELEHYVERCLATSLLEPLGDDEPEPPPPSSTPLRLREARQHWINAFEARYLRELLERHGGNVSASARAAGVDRKYFHRLLVKHGLR